MGPFFSKEKDKFSINKKLFSIIIKNKSNSILMFGTCLRA